jgi:hypothetical protein
MSIKIAVGGGDGCGDGAARYFDVCFLELKRDIILRLLHYFHVDRKQKIKNVIGLCRETYWWRNHYLLEEVRTDNYSFDVVLKMG